MSSSRLSPFRRFMFATILAGLVVVYLELLLQVFYYATVGDFLFRRALPPIYAADPVRCYRVASDLEYVHRTNEFDDRRLHELTRHANGREPSRVRDRQTRRRLSNPCHRPVLCLRLGCKLRGHLPDADRKGLAGSRQTRRSHESRHAVPGIGAPALLDPEGGPCLPARHGSTCFVRK